MALLLVSVLSAFFCIVHPRLFYKLLRGGTPSSPPSPRTKGKRINRQKQQTKTTSITTTTTLFTCLFVCLLVRFLLFVYSFVSLCFFVSFLRFVSFVCLFVYLYLRFVCLFLHLFVCLFVRSFRFVLFVLSVCLFLHFFIPFYFYPSCSLLLELSPNTGNLTVESAFETVLHSLVNQRDIQRLWIEYLLYQRSRVLQAEANSFSSQVKIMEELVNRCSMSVGSSCSIPHSTAGIWHDYSFHTQVQSCYDVFNLCYDHSACNDTFSHDTIHIPIQLSRYDTLHNNKTRRVLPRVLLVGSEGLFGKSLCIRTKKRKEGEH